MPFSKGNVLAPGGARKGAGRKPNALRDELPKLLETAVPKTQRIAIIKALATNAQNGDVKAAGLILGYLYGKPVERKEVTGPDGEAISLQVSLDRDIAKIYGDGSDEVQPGTADSNGA